MRAPSRRITPIRRLAILCLVSIACALAAACTKDKTLSPGPSPVTRTTPTNLLQMWFERVYGSKDSAGYAEMLDEEFQFEFLIADADSLQSRGILAPGQTYWGRTLDLLSTGRMFREPTVGDISLDIHVNQVTPDPQEGCDDCQFVVTNVTLTIVTDPGSADPTILTVNSYQDFFVRKDRSAGADTTLWVIWRQYDKERAGI